MSQYVKYIFENQSQVVISCDCCFIFRPDTWKRYEKEKADDTRAALLEIGPILGEVFAEMGAKIIGNARECKWSIK